MKKQFIKFLAIIFVFALIPLNASKAGDSLADRLKGRILLQVESNGEAWYVNPANSKRYYMANGEEAYNIMRELGIGITNENLKTLQSDKTFAKKHSGKIFLQVEKNGEAFYVDINGSAHYLKNGEEAYNIMRELGLGIINNDLNQIEVEENISINLIKNNKWNIFVKAPEIVETSMYLYFDIYRDGEEMSVTTYAQDSNTGELKKYLLGDYSVSFKNKFDAYVEDGYAKYEEDVYLLLYDNWYDYPSLKVGFNSESYYIPVSIEQRNVDGILETHHEYDEERDSSDNISTEVEIREKANTEPECLVKGFSKSSGRFYYTVDSSRFDNLSKFECFINEESAITDGYKKSYDN